MRNLFALQALLGLAGIVCGVLTMIQHGTGPRAVPFEYENYGGPGAIIAGIVMTATSLYLRSVWPRRS